MQTAYAYARVSSREQKEKKNSIPEQERRVAEFANKNNITITKKFQDSNSAFHDENRTDFDKMIKLALIERPNFIIIDDSSRFARTRQVSINTKKELRSHGIKILYASEPNIDTDTVSGFWLESIQETKNEATSLEISYHTKKGMAGNLSQRDNETGWCYKNGGKAPYGYKRQVLNKGFNNKGKPIFKTIWLLDEETAPIARKIIVDMYTESRMSYKQIRDYLNNDGIKNAKGELWSISTIMSMLKEDRLEQYTGTAIWNKENNNLVGVKYNKKEDWIICENAHPAIITREEYQKAMERKERTSNRNYKPKLTNDYLLSGDNANGEYLFTCSNCGGHVVGCSTGKKHKRQYACANNRNKGKCACENTMKVDKDWLEDKIVHIIEENYICDKKIEKYVEQIYQEVCKIDNIYEKQIEEMNREISQINSKIKNLLETIEKGLDTEIVIERINELKQQKEELMKKIQTIKEKSQEIPEIEREDIQKYFYNFKELFKNSTIIEKKELLKTIISNITLNEKKHHIEISFYSQWCTVLEQVAGIEPA